MHRRRTVWPCGFIAGSKQHCYAYTVCSRNCTAPIRSKLSQWHSHTWWYWVRWSLLIVLGVENGCAVGVEGEPEARGKAVERVLAACKHARRWCRMYCHMHASVLAGASSCGPSPSNLLTKKDKKKLLVCGSQGTGQMELVFRWFSVAHPHRV